MKADLVLSSQVSPEDKVSSNPQIEVVLVESLLSSSLSLRVHTGDTTQSGNRLNEGLLSPNGVCVVLGRYGERDTAGVVSKSQGAPTFLAR